MGGGHRLSILAIAVAALLQYSAAQTTHYVGDDLGWLVPPGGPIAYQIWADAQTFTVGDILVFNFTDGEQDVALVTKEAFKNCNSTDPISLKTTSPANFTLNTTGEYYFISTKDRHCWLGQKLAINVTEYPGPSPSPTPRSGPVTYTVGDDLGWLVPPGGELFYAAWAYDKIFLVGDTLVFNFVNGSQDVAIVTKDNYRNCTNSTIEVYTTSPANITLTTIGEHYFTSTYEHHCFLGQKLAINVTGKSIAPTPSGSIAPTPSGSIAVPPSSSVSHGPTAAGPAPPPVSSAPNVNGCLFTSLLVVVVAFFY